MDLEIKSVFLYIFAFGISDLIMEQMNIKSFKRKIVYLSLIFLMYYLL
jgi:hypothetical protein